MSKARMTTREMAEKIGRTHDEVIKAVIEFGQYTCEPLDEMCSDDGFILDRDFSLILAGHFGLDAAFAIGSDWRYLDALNERVEEARQAIRTSPHALLRSAGPEISAAKARRRASFKTYIVFNPLTGLIKVGKAMNPSGRIRDVGHMAGTTLQVLAVIGANIEGELHRQFSAIRVHGEWFSDDGQIRAYCASIDQTVEA